MRARIYRPAKNAMQSGRGKTKRWILEFEPAQRKSHEPLMGWTTSFDTKEQVRLSFESADQAIRYATRHNLPYTLIEPRDSEFKSKSYAQNFDRKRKIAWTH